MNQTVVIQPPSFPGTYWQWRGHSIYYVRAGEPQPGKAPILLVHGFGASTDHWRKNLAGLQSNWQVWAIDLLGFGRSSKPNLQYSGDLWRDQLHDFIGEVIKQPTVVVGNSLGGYACLCVAAQRHESVVGLILINSAGPFSDSDPVANPPQKNSWRQMTGKLSRSVLLQPWASYVLFQYVRRKSRIRQTLEQVYLDLSAVTDQLVEDIYRPSCDPGALQVFISVFKTPQGEKVDRLLQQLQCPLLMLWGEGDPWMNARTRGAKFRQFYPNLTEYYLNAGHCPHDEIPEQINNLIDSWLSSVNDRDN